MEIRTIFSWLVVALATAATVPGTASADVVDEDVDVLTIAGDATPCRCEGGGRIAACPPPCTCDYDWKGHPRCTSSGGTGAVRP